MPSIFGDVAKVVGGAALIAGGVALTGACVYYAAGIETLHCAQIGAGAGTAGALLIASTAKKK